MTTPLGGRGDRTPTRDHTPSPRTGLSAWQRTALLVVASVQLASSVAAWADLLTRPKNQVSGQKARWAAIIGVAFVGPLAYWTGGRRPHGPHSGTSGPTARR